MVHGRALRWENFLLANWLPQREEATAGGFARLLFDRSRNHSFTLITDFINLATTAHIRGITLGSYRTRIYLLKWCHLLYFWCWLCADPSSSSNIARPSRAASVKVGHRGLILAECTRSPSPGRFRNWTFDYLTLDVALPVVHVFAKGGACRLALQQRHLSLLRPKR